MKAAKIGIAVALLVVAAIILWRYTLRAEQIPDTEETRALWMCSSDECLHVFEMTAREEAEAQKLAEGQPWPPGVCPKCGKRTAYHAQKCPECETVFFGPEVEGWTGACPKCYPDEKPPEEYYPIEEGEEAPRPRPKAI